MKATEHGPAANGDPLFAPENERRIAANRIAHVRSPSLQHSRTYMGSVMSFLVTGAHTGGRFAMMEYRAKPGNEPPPHVHEWEDEFYHVLDGSADFHCGAERLRAIAGDYRLHFLPSRQAAYLRHPVARNPDDHHRLLDQWPPCRARPLFRQDERAGVVAGSAVGGDHIRDG